MKSPEVVCKRAKVTAYAKPFHALRKSCITDWAARFPAHVVKEWAGHADIRTTLKYYLKVSDGDHRKAAGLPSIDAASHQGDDLEQATREAVSSSPGDSNLDGDGEEWKEPAVNETTGFSHCQGQGQEVVPVPSPKLTQLLTQPGVLEPQIAVSLERAKGFEPSTSSLGTYASPLMQIPGTLMPYAFCPFRTSLLFGNERRHDALDRSTLRPFYPSLGAVVVQSEVISLPLTRTR